MRKIVESQLISSWQSTPERKLEFMNIIWSASRECNIDAAQMPNLIGVMYSAIVGSAPSADKIPRRQFR